MRLFWMLTIAVVLSCCQPPIKQRSYGRLKLGKLESFSQAQYYFPEKRLLLKKDSSGYSVMSTASTLDLSPLERIEQGQEQFWISSDGRQRYSADGKVLAGKAKADLPYYQLELGPGIPGGSADTLFVLIGVKKPADWRLAARQ